MTDEDTAPTFGPSTEGGQAVDGPAGVALWRIADPHDVPAAGEGALSRLDRWDHAEVQRLLGRPARSAFAVVVRRLDTGTPVVIRNPPLLDDGTPMPTRYWLLDFLGPVGTVESAGGVRSAEAEVGPQALVDVHQRYAAERDAAIPPDWPGPRPSGGVGGTRRGVKCLHTHYAHWLATGDDPVGAYTHARLAVLLDGPS